jgi:hypothetical protein
MSLDAQTAPLAGAQIGDLARHTNGATVAAGAPLG